MERVLIVDGAYFKKNNLQEQEFYKEHFEEIQDKFGIINKTYYSNAFRYQENGDSKKETKEKEKLELIPNIEIKLGYMSKINGRIVQKQVDANINLAIHNILENKQTKELIFLSGDGDFVPFLNEIKKVNIKLIILAKKETCCKSLIKISDSFYSLEELKNNISLNSLEFILKNTAIKCKDESGFSPYAKIGSLLKKLDISISSINAEYKKLNEFCKISYKNEKKDQKGVYLYEY